MRIAGLIAVASLVLIGLIAPHPSRAAANAPGETRDSDAATNSEGGATWATFKRIDVAEQRSSYSVFAARNAGRVAAGGSAVSRAQHSGRPDGCYSHTLGSTDGALRLLEICPGRGGYRGGTAAEAFGISLLRLADPTTGEPLPTAGSGELIVADPRALAERAAAALRLPAPVIRMSPEQDQVTQLASWLWIPGAQWQPRQVAASAGPVTSTVTASPARVTWNMGNGDQVTCNGPGRPYHTRYEGRPEATDCKYTYRHSSAGQPGETYSVTATIDWDLTWDASGAPGGGGLGSVPMSATEAVRVTEIQALVQ